jgi:hypothetical protein
LHLKLRFMYGPLGPCGALLHVNGWSFAPPGWLKRSFWVGKKMGPFGSFWIGSNWSPLSFLPCSAVALLHASQAHLSALRAAQLLKQYCSSLRSYLLRYLAALVRCLFISLRSILAAHMFAALSICYARISLRYVLRSSLRSIAAHIHYVHICSLTIRCAHCSLYCSLRYSLCS